MVVDRRRHRRFVLQTEIRVIRGAGESAGKLLDVSAGGALIAAPGDVEVEVGAGAFVHFVDDRDGDRENGRGSRVCEATGHVVRTLPLGRELGMAIEFAFANDALIEFLHTWGRTADALRPELLARLSDIQVRLP